MCLLLIFVLTFTLSAHGYNYGEANADAEYMENGNAVMAKVMNAIGEEGREQVTNALDEYDLQKLMDCIESECGMADFMDLMQKMLTVFKGISHGDNLIYKSIKTFIKHGALAEFINTLTEEHTMEIINALNAGEIGKLMNMGTDQINISELISIGKKIIPIIKNANGGKGLSKLIRMFTDDLDGKHSMFTDDLDGKYALPYHHSVPGGLRPGISVYVQGTVLEDSKSSWINFNVDFACGKNQGGDIPLHFNPRLNAGKVVLNTFQAGRWGHEEGQQLPFQKGEDFEIIFIVSEAGYQILVNKKPFCTYKHRIPPQSVKVIHVKGDLELNSVNVTQNMTLPYHHSVPGGLRPGISVYVQGTVPKHSNSSWMNFNVDFACGENQGGDVPLHFNPQFNAGKVVLNTFQAGQWGHEEGQQLPFQKGEHFEIIFIVTEAGYQILVNKKPFCTYKHKIPPQSVKVIHVKGDLELNSLNVTSGPTTQNMALPYHQPVSGGFCPGKSVYVQGTVPQNSKRFEVNFACGQHDGANIAFQFKIYFNWQKTVLNTFRAGKWGHEEHHEIPFLKGEDFEVIFIVNEAKYQILVNSKPFCIYMHRIPPQSVTVINVKGQVELQSLNVKEMENMTVPYTGNIPGGLGANRTITVRGSIPKNAKRFQINFMAGQDIALYISPRMEQRIVIRNSFLYGRWGPEERYLPFNPFQPGQFFELSIHCDNHKFKVYANGQPFFNYTHRYVPIEDICTLEIHGDVTLSYIKY